jgi:hypothetical protein
MLGVLVIAADDCRRAVCNGGVGCHRLRTQSFLPRGEELDRSARSGSIGIGGE